MGYLCNQLTDGSIHNFFYNRLGFRERVERSDGSQTTYQYDVAGNLIRAEGHKHTADSAADGHTFEINHNSQPEIIRFANGEVLTVQYDASGNPERITSSNPEAPALEYSYDGARYNQMLRSTLGNPSFPEQGLNMSSGWRNPERNEAVGGVVNSIHQYGNAVDLQILGSTASASGLSTSQLWTILRDAGASVAATAICENGPTQVSCSNVQVSHVHVQN